VRGKTIGPVIIIGKLYKRDIGLLEHEMVHAEDFWLRGLFIHMLLYKFVPKYRLEAECRAFYAQWHVEPTKEKKADFTDRLWLFYNLKYSREYIDKVFSSYFDKWDIR